MTKTRDFYGPYRLTRLIRSGSTAEVWEAIEEHENKRYALKILKGSMAKDRAEVALLKHEYNVGQDLQNSPRIIKILDYRIANERPFLVLQLFSELNIKQALRRGPDSLAFMLSKIIEQAGEGLYYMHTRGWIHLDIKPDNFLVSRDGETKLIDFTISEKKKSGIGKLFHRKSLAKGTRSYMAPEQIRRKVCDERTDVYSFGCVLFEMATGKPPFTGDTPNDLLNKHLNAQVPSSIAYNNNVSKDFADLIKRMMQKAPSARPQSMWDFLKEVRTMELWSKRPRKPEVSVFDDMPGIRGADDMLRKPSKQDLSGDEEASED